MVVFTSRGKLEGWLFAVAGTEALRLERCFLLCNLPAPASILSPALLSLSHHQSVQRTTTRQAASQEPCQKSALCPTGPRELLLQLRINVAPVFPFFFADKRALQSQTVLGAVGT